MKRLLLILLLALAPGLRAANFASFTELTTPAGTEYLIGYATATSGGERRITLANISAYVRTGYSSTSTINGWFADPSTNGSFSASAWRSDLGLVIGTNVQAFDADLLTWAGVTPSANGQSLVAAANYAAMRALLDLEAGTDFLAYPTGTPTGSKFLRDDNTWQTIPGGGDMLAANNLSDVGSAATAFANIKQAATTSATGVVELATDGETAPSVVVQGNDSRLSNARTPSDASVTTAKVAGSTLVIESEGIASNDNDTTIPTSAAVRDYVDGVSGKRDVWMIAISDETTALTTGTAKVTFRAPRAATVTGVRASLTTVSSSGTPTFDINEGGTTILSTKLTVDASEKTSTTAAAAAVISDTALADDSEITIDIDTAGTGATGAKIAIYVTY